MRLAELRKQAGLSQKQLAAILKCSQNMISQWENGTRDPGTKTLKLMAECFNVSIDYILEHDSAAAAPQVKHDTSPDNGHECAPVNLSPKSSAENFILNNCEKILIKKYRQLSSDAQARIDKLIDFEIFSQNADNTALLEDTGSA